MPPKADRVLACPSCSFRVTGKEKACPRCGKAFAKGMKFECPFCGAPISKNSKRCPSCQIDLTSIGDQASEEEAGGPEPQPEEDLKLKCPGCGEPLTGYEAECPKCWRALSGRLGLRCPLCGTPIDKCLAACPICGTSIERMMQRGKPAGAAAETHPCPQCRAVIPDGLKNCPLCNADLTKTVEPQGSDSKETVTEEPKAEIIEVPPAEVAAPADTGTLVGQVTEAPRPARQRKLKAKVTTVPVTSQTGVRGLTNGVGQINGLGKVNGTGRINGTGAVNGRAFVNGTGTPSGPPSRRSSSSAKRTALRWQLLVLLIAVVIVIPTVMFLSFSNDGGKYSIDGNFDEWNDATTFGARVMSTSASNNITAWAVASESSYLFLYIQTQAPMMASSSAESFYLFVDSDGKNATGYLMESIGADYMIQLSGWDSAVRSAQMSVHEGQDQTDWSSWSPAGDVSCRVDLARLEARASMPTTLADSAKFLLISKDSLERGSISFTAPLDGGTLIVRQSIHPAVTTTGIVPRANSAAILTLRFTCDGVGGDVTQADPVTSGAPLVTHIEPFSLQKGQEKMINVSLDTSALADGQLVSAEMVASTIISSFASVEIVGFGAKAYVGAPTLGIEIDGAFADWHGKLSVDNDPLPITAANVDIEKVGNVSDDQDSFFYVSVNGELCSGTFVPALVAKPASTGGTPVLPSRRTAEDVLDIYIDSDISDSTGKVVTIDSKRIGADQRVEIKGLFGRITSATFYHFYQSSASWVASSDPVDAAKDEHRIEIGVAAASLGSSQIDFIVETTSWKGPGDLATFDPSSMSPTTRTWLVDPGVTSPYATSMSYQRKMFYDGINYWSFYFDGANTVHKYSTDGAAWNYCGRVFTTSGVNETSVWFDASSGMVYAVGDTSSATQNVPVQAGSVDPAGHTISWLASDSNASVSRLPLAGKNTFISKDASGFLWILSSNLTQVNPQRVLQLSAFRSAVANDTTAWKFSGNMLEINYGFDNLKGSIVPAGKGGDVWAVYGFAGGVYSRKCQLTWQAQQTIYLPAGSKASTDNSPPSVVVDGKGVVHVVYGTGRRAGQLSIPMIEYAHNLSGLMTFTPGVSLDPLLPVGVGDYYPTISIEASTGDLYALWLRGDSTLVPRTVMCSVFASGTWSSIVLPPQTAFPKFFLTSIYIAPGPLTVCWQWTENDTIPIEVMFDGTMIPEFGDLLVPIVGFAAIFVSCRRTSRRRREE